MWKTQKISTPTCGKLLADRSVSEATPEVVYSRVYFGLSEETPDPVSRGLANNIHEIKNPFPKFDPSPSHMV